jgi:hypothetical protein
MKIFTLLSLSLLLYNCNIHTPAARHDYNLIIENNTSKSIQIITYRNETSLYRSHFKTISINPFSDYTESFTYDSWHMAELDDGLFYNTDSVAIVYKKEKFKSFTCLSYGFDNNCNELRNPLQFKRETNIQYIITEEDYENAEECDERCE